MHHGEIVGYRALGHLDAVLKGTTTPVNDAWGEAPFTLRDVVVCGGLWWSVVRIAMSHQWFEMAKGYRLQGSERIGCHSTVGRKSIKQRRGRQHLTLRDDVWAGLRRLLWGRHYLVMRGTRRYRVIHKCGAVRVG